MNRQWLLGLLLLSIMLAACASPTPATAPTQTLPPSPDGPAVTAPADAPADAPAASGAAPTLIYFHATW